MSESPTDPEPNSPLIPQVIPDIIQAASDEYDSETETLDASISDYRKEYGRTYHRYKEGSYPFPNDAPELDRLDEQHEIFIKLLLGGKLHMAPLEAPRMVWDIGTGTGIWPIDMGDLYRDAQVIGTDLSPVQHSEVPPNVIFEIEDCSEDEWLRPEDSFDLIHVSMMIGALKSYRKLVKTSYQYIKPGDGWLECWELSADPKCDDGTMKDDYGFKEWEESIAQAAFDKEPPRSTRYAPKISSYMRSAGFIDIQEQIYKLPLNSWPSDPHFKEIGDRWGEMMLAGVSGFSYKFMGAEGFGWPKHEIEVWLAGVRKAMKDRNIHAYQTLHVVWGRKPSKEEEPEVQQRLAAQRAKRKAQKLGSNQPAEPQDSAAFTGPASGKT